MRELRLVLSFIFAAALSTGVSRSGAGCAGHASAIIHEDRSYGEVPEGTPLVLTSKPDGNTGGIFVKIGIVKWFNPRKGYGVIKPVDGGFDVYVNIKAVERAGLAELKEGQKVNFDIVADDRTGEVFAENLSVPLNRQDNIMAGPAATLKLINGRSQPWASRQRPV